MCVYTHICMYFSLYFYALSALSQAKKHKIIVCKNVFRIMWCRKCRGLRPPCYIRLINGSFWISDYSLFSVWSRYNYYYMMGIFPDILVIFRVYDDISHLQIEGGLFLATARNEISEKWWHKNVSYHFRSVDSLWFSCMQCLHYCTPTDCACWQPFQLEFMVSDVPHATSAYSILSTDFYFE